MKAIISDCFEFEKLYIKEGKCLNFTLSKEILFYKNNIVLL